MDENLDDEDKLIVTGDEQLMKTALSNIIENGCKYSQDNTTSVILHSSRTGISIDFKDKGIGIPAGDIQKIFEPFYRGSNTKNIKGHGIGLSMVRGIIKLHKGELQLHSSVNRGTTVTIRLPTVA